MNEREVGAVLAAPSQEERVRRDTGLTAHQQRERATVARLWAWRIAWLLETTGCRVADALRATEETDKEHAR